RCDGGVQMSDFPEHDSLARRFRARSMGAKLIAVCGLAALMTLPAFYVSGLVDERTARAREVAGEISGYSGGQQMFLGPTLAIPIRYQNGTFDTFFIFPERASATIKTTTEERHRSLFKVPVFQADISFDAAFDLTGLTP